MRNSVFVKVQAVPLLKQIEQRDRVGESHLEIYPDSLPQMFKTTNLREQGKNGFNQHSVVPRAFQTNLQILGLVAAPKAIVSQNNHLFAYAFDQRQKALVGNIGGRNRPIGNQSELVCQKTKFAADNPLPRGVTFFADTRSVRLMILPYRMTQLDAVGINHAEEGWLGKKLFRQLAVRFQSPKKPRPLGQSGKQINPVLPNPAVESALRHSFESKQQTQSYEFALGEFGLFVFRRLRQHIIYTAKKFYDKVFLSHGFVSFVFGLVTFTLETFP